MLCCMFKICSLEECEKPVHCLGLCQPHYRQERRRQRGLSKPGPKPEPTKRRSRYRDRSVCPEGHLLDDANVELDSRGHRLCGICKRARLKTRCPQGHPYTEENSYVYENARHCKTCLRLRARERRTGGPRRGTFNASKTHCPQGHGYTPDNTYWYKNRRHCRACVRSQVRRRELRKFGLTWEAYEALLLFQQERCGSCREPFSTTPQVDHDHQCCNGNYSCGKCVRGLLCPNCNSGLGRFEDSTERLQAAIDYLKDPPSAKLCSVQEENVNG
jgi:Recombination endonuclease VII